MKILMLTESNFPLDTRIRLEAYTLARHGHKVSVIAIKDHDQPYSEAINGVKVYRIPRIEVFKRGKQVKTAGSSPGRSSIVVLKGVVGYGFEYAYFTIACFILSLFMVMKDNFDVIHTHNPPDTLFSVALFFKIFGKRFIYDHHDLSPELFLEKYQRATKLIYKMLLLLERMSCKLADVIIATNVSYKNIQIERCGARPSNIYVVRNGPDLNELRITEPIQQIKSMNKKVLCYLGEINIQDGVEYLIVVLSKLVHQHNRQDVLLLIIGDGDYLHQIKLLANKNGLNRYIIFTGLVTDRNELSKYLSTADIFVDAAPYSFLNDNSTFIKHMEYMIYEKPIISFALKESMFSLQDAGLFVPPNDTEKFARTIIELINDKKRRELLGLNASRRFKDLSWDKVSKPLIEAYEKLAKHF